MSLYDVTLPLGYVRWDGGPREAMEQAVAEWLAGRPGGTS